MKIQWAYIAGPPRGKTQEIKTQSIVGEKAPTQAKKKDGVCQQEPKF
jgi:hypothetical protein